MKKIKLIDLWIVIPYIVLLGIGVVMVYSASFYNSLVHGGNTTSYLIKQAIFALVGLGICYLVFMLKEQILKSRGVLSFLGIITWGSLLFLIVKGFVSPSSRVNGASGWIDLKFFNFQPLELAKIVFILYLALVLTSKKDRLNEMTVGGMYRDNKAQLFFLGSIILMVAAQPDIGGALILAVLCIVLISASSIPSRMMIIMDSLIVVTVTTALILLFTLKPPLFVHSYQYQRFLAMQHPFQLEKEAGAQIVNSFYAISNGGVFGVGLGNSIQKRGYLPEPHTDFILSIISEELGLIGVVVVLGLIMAMILRMLLVGLRSKNTYSSLVYYGVATMMLTQTILNVGGLLGFIPLTGVTLPFISYGGSSMIVLSLGLGIVLNLEASEKYQSIKSR
ncbi:FtsW/RodA/SpoVE family cell cycle protein [Companilactobacillus furfuricola]|uniref:FtsW/RodA/SpoVE family cell cycle protein n=1 Tax=Companilactobacillus furfuricola TaxID=1462575 RepID=UPI000F7AA438|nr:FtsW/RodA/SpoVE family cell cycle protein [Companilactobacillus furfuricola]